MKSKHLAPALVTAALALALALPANAQTTSGNLPVLANVIEVCVLNVAAPVNFLDYDPTAAAPDTDGIGQLDVTCTQGSLATILLDAGANGNRTMADGFGNFLAYELTTDGSTLWGDGGLTHAGAALAPVAAPDNTTRSFSVQGIVAAGQNVPANPYTDTVTVTVNW